jgi:hypothetical protein
MAAMAMSSIDTQASVAVAARSRHWTKDCHQLKKERVNLTQTEEEEESSLLMVMVEINVVKSGPQQVIEPTPQQQQVIHLDETKPQVFLGMTFNDDDRLEGWYLDTGTMNHMTGRDVFSKLNRAVQGTVKFGDSSVVNICGKGTVIFSGRHGEHNVLTGIDKRLLDTAPEEPHHQHWADGRGRLARAN